MSNPIIDNRIVSDKTFAIRLYNFLNATQVNDMASEEEKEYLLEVARRLMAHQKATINTAAESDYFRMMGI